MDIETIIRFAILVSKSRDGLAFQEFIGVLLEAVYKKRGCRFVMPQPAGGDCKNDGYCVEESVYYGMFAPATGELQKSFTQALYEKFERDFSGLADKVYDKNNPRWTHEIKRYVFVANLKSRNLPPDSTNRVEKAWKSVESRFNISIESVEIISVSQLLERELTALTCDELSQIIKLQNLYSELRLYVETEPDLVGCINAIANLALGPISHAAGSDYSRKSLDEKISINDLHEVRELIKERQLHAGLVEAAIAEKQTSASGAYDFERVKDFIIQNYHELYDQGYRGSQLFTEMIDSIIMGSSGRVLMPRRSVEILVVYIFELCDIFEKEGDVQ